MAFNERVVVATVGQFMFYGLHDRFQRIRLTGFEILFQCPAALAIEAVERADFLIDRHEVDAQRLAQTSAVYRAESDGFPKEC